MINAPFQPLITKSCGDRKPDFDQLFEGDQHAFHVIDQKTDRRSRSSCSQPSLVALALLAALP
jgi:hypothetical protein